VALDPLATPEDATGYGYTLGDTATVELARASVRIRRAAGQPITPSVVTIRLRADGRRVQLPAPPVMEVQSVSVVACDGTTTPLDGWQWTGTDLLLPRHCPEDIEVVYRRGWDPVPDGVVELVCAVADRLANTARGMDVGIRSQQIDDYQVTYAAEQVQTAGDLLPGEQTALDKALGRVPDVWVVSASG
jgi:hypothetical protein